MISSVGAGSEWRLEDRVEEVELTPDGQLVKVRYEGDTEFVTVENVVDKDAVKGLSFQERDLHLSVYLVEEGSTLVGIKNKWVTRTVLKDILEISGPVRVQLAHSVEGTMIIRYPDGQEARISQSGVVVNGLPELRTLYFHEGPATNLNFADFRSFTLFEFFDPKSNQIFSRNVVTEVANLKDATGYREGTLGGRRGQSPAQPDSA